MQPMSSMQTTLLPGVTPGWNDPPPIGNPSAGSRLNRYRRVVDPSLSAAGGSPTPYASSPQPGMAMGAPHGMPMQPMQQPVQPMMQMQQPPQYVQQPMQHMQYMPPQQYAQPDYSMSTSPPPPTPPSVPQQHQLQGGQGDVTTTSPPPPIPVLNHQQPLPAGDCRVSGVSLPPMAPSLAQPSLPHPHPQAILANPSQWDPNVDYADQARQAQLKHHQQQEEEQRRQQEMAAFNAFSRAPSAHSSPAQFAVPSTHQLDPSSYVFNHPPNAVYAEEEEGKLMQYVDMSSYRPPSKAPGDVSLPPTKLHEFLVKAATTLHNSKSQGVQLRLRDLPDELRGMSADLPFIKKFNYLVDYIDRSMLDEAHEQLTQLVSAFPSETFLTTPGGFVEKKWVGGIKFLIQELRRVPAFH